MKYAKFGYGTQLKHVNHEGSKPFMTGSGELGRDCMAGDAASPTLSRAVTGLLTGHNTLRRHLHLLGLLDSLLCRRRGVKEETSAHILCKCEVLAKLRHAYLGSFFLEPEDIRSISLGGQLELQ